MTVKNVVYPRKIHYFGRLIKLCQTTGCGVPKEPKIMKMDWKALGYEREYKDGKLKWVPQRIQNTSSDSESLDS